MSEPPDPLRVAFLAGTLGHGGAEGQLVYLARALQQARVTVRVYTLGENEFYEAALRDTGLGPIGIGRAANPMVRLVTFARALRQFRPHIVQAAHFYVNLYVALAARLCGSLSIGAIPSDVVLDLQDTGHWGPLLLRAPSALWTNSQAARCNATRLGISGAKIHLVTNVIDTTVFDRACRLRPAGRNATQVVAIVVAQLVRAKRVDRFLEALALARRSTPELKGVVAGDGPERSSLEAHAGRLGLLADGVQFLGWSDDVPGLLAGAHMLVLTSDHEGLPNVVLEAMAARLPVVTTPAGDAAAVVEDGVNGFVVPFDGVEELVDRLIRLARSPALRQQFGEAGYQRVKARYASAGLGDQLIAVYRAAAQHSGYLHALTKLPARGARPISPVVSTNAPPRRTGSHQSPRAIAPAHDGRSADREASEQP
jgi:glycosyltransferase involved in cell wall biosynthesis